MTFLAVTLAWIPFRSQGFENLIDMLKAMVRVGGATSLANESRIAVLAVLAATLSWHALARKSSFEDRLNAMPPVIRGLVLAVMLVAIVLSSNGDSRAFIYFQF